MENKGRFNLLICICVIILTGLVSIQYYLLRNTHQLNLTNYHNQVKAAISKMYADSVFQEVNHRYLKNLIHCAKLIHRGEIDQVQFEQTLRENNNKNMNSMDSLYRARPNETVRIEDIHFRTGYSLIKVEYANKAIVNLIRPEEKARLLKPIRKGFDMLSLGQNNGSIDQTGIDSLRISYINLIYLEIPKLPVSILKQLALVGGLSLILLIAVVTVFYKVIRSAQRQRKITDLREDLVNNITHELKTPLSSMAIAFKMLHLKAIAHDTKEQKELIQNLERQHKKLSTTVERVLESSVNKDAVRAERIDVVALLNNYKKTLLLDSHKLDIFTGDEPCYVLGIEGPIVAAIDNLVENAQKYSAVGSLIRIEGKREWGKFRIDVIDAGIGIDKIYQDYLFEKFFRVPQRYVHSVQGLGLGLYLSRQSVQSFGGDLQLTNSSAQGSIFTIYLPLE